MGKYRAFLAISIAAAMAAGSIEAMASGAVVSAPDKSVLFWSVHKPSGRYALHRAMEDCNARFGGGYPLAHRAGARFTDWLLDEMEGKRLSSFDDWTDDLAMLRYDEAVFVPGSSIRTWSETSALSSTSTTRYI